MAGLGVPAHVTLLFPFIPRGSISVARLSDVATIAEREPSFEAALTAVRRFPSSEPAIDAVLWLAPEPVEPFLRLTAAIAATYPDYPPYGGIHDEVIPHLTIATGSVAGFDHLEAEIRGHLPVLYRVGEAALLLEDEAGRWSVGERFRLG